jgi:hypothetical protein
VAQPSSAADIYFFLSHAHIHAQLSDHWVRIFYNDLHLAVRSRASPPSGREFGSAYFPPAQPRDDGDFRRAINTARVFVPLYTREYLYGLPREYTAYQQREAHDRIRAARHVQPVLWKRIPEGRHIPPELRSTMMRLGEGIPVYAENGLSTMYQVDMYADDRAVFVAKLADRIVDLAEQAWLPPVAADERERPIMPPSDGLFVISVVAPTEFSTAAVRHPARYGPNCASWRPFADPPIAERVAKVAIGLQLPTRVLDDPGDERTDSGFGLLLIDPSLFGDADGRAQIERAFDVGAPWAAVIVLADDPDPAYDALADEIMARFGAAHSLKQTRGVREFTGHIIDLVPRLRRRYLNEHPLPRQVRGAFGEEESR